MIFLVFDLVFYLSRIAPMALPISKVRIHYHGMSE